MYRDLNRVGPPDTGLGMYHPVDRFLCIHADTHEAKQHHYALRYKVFCEETGFENSNAFPLNVERDQYDDYARHFIVLDRLKRQWVGAMRLVDASAITLPSEEIAGSLNGLDDTRGCAVEFSRLCISSEYRSTTQAVIPHSNEEMTGLVQHGRFPTEYKQADNDVLLRLLRASFAWRPEVEYCYFIVTKALSRVLRRFGIPLEQVGHPVEHRGMRIPFRYDVSQADWKMRETLSSFSEMVERSPPYINYSDFVRTACSNHPRSSGFYQPQVIEKTSLVGV